jgi:hypothetical protein
LIRDDPDGCLNASVFARQMAPGDKSNLLVPTAHAGVWTVAQTLPAALNGSGKDIRRNRRLLH